MHLRTLHLHKSELERLPFGTLRLLAAQFASSDEGRADRLAVTAIVALRVGRVDQAIDAANEALSIVRDHEVASATLDNALLSQEAAQ